jgi:HK97 family phage major capsid protein
MITVTEALKNWLIDNQHCPSTWTDEQLYRKRAAELLAEGTLDNDTFKKLLTNEEVTTMAKSPSPNPDTVFDRGGSVVYVKDPSERLSTKRYACKNRFGETVVDPIYNKEVETLSERDAARTGVLFKHLAHRSGAANCPLSEWERELLAETCEKADWAGQVNGVWYDHISGHANIKALIDDAASGGIEIAPIFFDEDVYSQPLLSGELFPDVDLRPVPRGRRIEGASIGHPTVQWGGVDDTSVDLFNTADLVAALDTTIHRAECAITVGRDLMSDTPVEIGNRITRLIGERLMQSLDRKVSNGNGTTEPEGIFQKSGVTSVNTDNGGSGPPTLNDYITLLFALGKQYRASSSNANRVRFISNDVTYRRSRAIKVDPQTSSTDQRPVLTGGDTKSFQDYMSLGLPHKIDTQLANTVAGICAMNRYRMYRRKGMEIMMSSQGQTLMLNNEMLIVMYARYGGQLYDAAAFAKWTDGQS